METIRPTAVAGLFYPANASELSQIIQNELSQVKPSATIQQPKALIVPHAGYIYSGPIAATAYAQLLPYHQQINRVVVIGPSHRVDFHGLAVSSAHYFDSPLGTVAIDQKAIEQLLTITDVHQLDQAHKQEHSLEVQLPFLQQVLDQFCIVPIVAGNASPELVATVLKAVWGGPETLIIISSDLSHYHDYQTAKKMDQITSHAIETCNPTISSENACGCIGVNGLLNLADEKQLTVTTLDCRNSGDTAGKKDSVVGYGAYLFVEES